VTRRCPIDVFRYLDYRAFLSAFYNARKSQGYSYRTFARRAGFASPNYLKLVIQGKRNLTQQMAERFANACNLKGDAKAYFQALVAFNQSQSVEDRNRFYVALSSFKRYRSAQKLELAHAAYYSKWYLPAIRELAARSDFKDDFEWIAEQLVPAITPRDATHALETLLCLGLLQRDNQGRIVQTTPVVTTGPETEGMHITNYHRAMMAQAAESMETIDATERDISSLTLCLGSEKLKALKKRIQAFRAELLELSETDRDPKQVVQINFQLFPLSRRPNDQGELK
jgi:uncharacterized protein (TIGR02147 family)